VEAVLGGLAPWVFIGKPCDVAGVRGVCGVRPDVAEGVGCRIAIFCAGTPSTRGTLGLLERVGMSPGQVRELRFRGRGWPGHLAVRAEGRQGLADTLGYEESWAFLQRFRPYRCHLCPDGTGELADIACGDPWCRTPRPGELGRSLVVVRTERGRQIVRGAIREGYVRLRRRPPRVLVDSQPGLYHKRAAVWGRVAAFRLCGLPAPRLGGFSLFANWRRRGVGEQARSVFGTVRRIVARGYLRRSTYLEGAVEAHGVPGVIRKSGIRIAQASSTASRARRWRGTGSPYLPQ
jgi:coenzyme F420 hydrogenase subunit beta